MSSKKQKLELTWIGKENRPRLEPRILLEDPEKSYHAKFRVKDGKGLTAENAKNTENPRQENSGSLRSLRSLRSNDPGDIFDNRLIFGDNLLALKALEQEFTGKVKCVFIDPPYNTGSAFEHYDDGVEHSLWLGLMRDRIEILSRLLRPDGSLWITIDDNEAHYLKILCDEVFGRRNFVANLVWQKRTARDNRKAFSVNHDHVLVYAADISLFTERRNLLPLTQRVMDRYKNPDNDLRGPWQSVAMTAQGGHATAAQFYELETPTGKKHKPPEGLCWVYTKEKWHFVVLNGWKEPV